MMLPSGVIFIPMFSISLIFLNSPRVLTRYFLPLRRIFPPVRLRLLFPRISNISCRDTFKAVILFSSSSIRILSSLPPTVSIRATPSIRRIFSLISASTNFLNLSGENFPEMKETAMIGNSP